MIEVIPSFDTVYERECMHALEAEQILSNLKPKVYALMLANRYRRVKLLRSVDLLSDIVTIGAPYGDERNYISASMRAGGALGVRVLRFQNLGTLTNISPRNEFSITPEDINTEAIDRILNYIIDMANDEFSAHQYARETIRTWFAKRALNPDMVGLGYGLVMQSAKRAWESSPSIDELLLADEAGLIDWDSGAVELTTRHDHHE